MFSYTKARKAIKNSKTAQHVIIDKPKSKARKRVYRLEKGMFPTHKTVLLRYVDSFYITSATGILASQKFRCNSIFDPNYMGVGYQPHLYDQYSIMY